jgi:hypothetical protein
VWVAPKPPRVSTGDVVVPTGRDDPRELGYRDPRGVAVLGEQEPHRAFSWSSSLATCSRSASSRASTRSSGSGSSASRAALTSPTTVLQDQHADCDVTVVTITLDSVAR